MLCKIRRIDLYNQGNLMGLDLPVDWQVEVDEVPQLENRHRLKFMSGHGAGEHFVLIEATTSQSIPEIRTGLRVLTTFGETTMVLKTTSTFPERP